jgi:long-chain acyl-CoA synthetase
MLNLSMFLEDPARKYPQREAVVMGDSRFTYEQVNALACQVANGLRSRGIGAGDHVAISCPNLPFFPFVYYGILKVGAVVVPLNVLLKGNEIAYHLNDSRAKAYFCFQGTAELPMGQMGWDGFNQADGCEQFYMITPDAAAPSPIEGSQTLGQLIHGQPTTFVTELRSPTDTAVILYTSGTTGRPKGAELTHSNMVTNAMVSHFMSIKAVDVSRVQTLLIALPLFHSFGQTVQMNAGFFSGSTLVLLPRFEPAVALQVMVEEKVTLFSGVPTMFWALLSYARQTGFDTEPVAENLVLCNSGGAAIPVEVLTQFEETFGVTILEGYGLSETSPVATFNQVGIPRKVGSIGVPIFGTEVKVVDEMGEPVPVDQPGEIVIRGHNVMKGYYNKPEANQEAFRDGWFRTGDIARMDADGYLFIMDRVKDMIIRGGFNVYPREIEEVLLTHPAVSMVAVIGIPHERHGEEIKAYVILKPNQQIDEQELIDWSREQMASYKYPRHIEFVESLPTSATGKILKRELRTDSPRQVAAQH